MEKLSGKPEWLPRHKGPRGPMDQKWRAWPRLISSRSRTEGASSPPLPRLFSGLTCSADWKYMNGFGPSNSSPCPKQMPEGPAPQPPNSVGVRGPLAYRPSMPARPPLLPSDRRARPSVAASQDASRARVPRRPRAGRVGALARLPTPAAHLQPENTHCPYVPHNRFNRNECDMAWGRSV